MPVLLAACHAGGDGAKARPALWLAEDADTRIYLLGTMHALPRGTDWNDGGVSDAIAAADELVLELAPRELARTSEAFHALAPRDTPLAMEKRLPQAALAKYRALEVKGGDALDDWAILILMGQRAAERAKLSSADGVEAGLTAAFRKAGKPVAGLETAQAQLMLFETLDAATQRALLTRAAARADRAVEDIAALTTAWSRGDVAALERMINEDVEAVPAARRAIVTDRNRAWADWAKRRMDRPGTVLMAVGAGHLVGADGVPALLAADGFEMRRVQ